MNGVDASSSTAELKIHFIVVGAGVAGLAAAFALTRVGHRVTVLEKGDGNSNRGPGGVRIPPNMSKVLFHWGLKDIMKEVGLTSHPLLFSQYHTGQLLGVQQWDDELLRETRGEFMLMTHGDLCQMLHEAAASQGAEIRYNAQVVDIEPEDGAVKLASGEVVRADLIIGADGERGMCRRMVLGREERIQPSGMALFDAQFGSETATKDMSPEEKRLLEKNPVYCAMGNGCGSTGYPIVQQQGREIAFHHFFRGDFPVEGSYSDPPTAKAELISLLPTEIDPNSSLYHCVHGADRVTRVAINVYENLEDWVHESGRLLVIGQAAHPIASGSIQVTAMAIEDAAVLGKLYHHLTIPEQASEFLYAFHDLRRQRCQDVLEGEVSMVSLITMEHGPEQEKRDNGMRAKYRAGKNVLEGDDTGGGEGEQWVTIRTIFGYDCEDEADNWWFQWGLLRARANSDGQNRQSQMGVFSWANMGIQSVNETTT
ncbi:FAD/NAD-P-binding domain-containing protein [Fomitopsis serialis]|uniref:FAD/NAD-P-binding domain-containing protein n=1 Tax=Fomitopsis serialis TaxID=139415 RepID=UPI002008C07C|nr:FAD/NAD-P-binding domain-containing protein [Neoantrodia serialis]KAH9928180.1 FAD/NAD-P-binding domain-containing protein [Neoantrodia serialis]